MQVYKESTVSKKVPRRDIPLGSIAGFNLYVDPYLLSYKTLHFLTY